MNQTNLITSSSPKLLKLKSLLENSKKSNTKILLLDSTKKMEEKSKDLTKDLSIYLSVIEKPINLLFSIDQFLFEFSKKTYQQKKTGEYFQQLKERKKLSLFYGGLSRKQLVNFFNKVQFKKGYFSKNLFSLLERRLDVVLYRSGITKTVSQARQLIKHKKILVNENLVSVPSFLIDSGDFISIKPETGNLLSDQIVKSVKKNM